MNTINPHSHFTILLSADDAGSKVYRRLLTGILSSDPSESLHIGKVSLEKGKSAPNTPWGVAVIRFVFTLLQPGAADKRDYEGTRAAASSCLSRVGRVGGVVGMLGI